MVFPHLCRLFQNFIQRYSAAMKRLLSRSLQAFMVTRMSHAFSCSSLSNPAELRAYFKKHGLKYVPGISIIFQMNQAKPPNHIGILFDCPVYLLLAPHCIHTCLLIASSAILPSLPCPQIIADAVAVCINKVPAESISGNAHSPACCPAWIVVVADGIVIFIDIILPAILGGGRFLTRFLTCCLSHGIVVADTVIVCINKILTTAFL